MTVTSRGLGLARQRIDQSRQFGRWLHMVPAKLPQVRGQRHSHMGSHIRRQVQDERVLDGDYHEAARSTAATASPPSVSRSLSACASRRILGASASTSALA